MELQNYRRKTPLMEAVQVTLENLKEVAEWCGTNWFYHGVGDQEENSCLKVNAWGYPGQMAYLGDWVIRYVESGNFEVAGSYFINDNELVKN